MHRLHLDYETFATVDIKKSTTHSYCAHPDTEILMLGWAYNDDEPQLWEPRLGPMPDALRQGLERDDIEKHAFNAPFERNITRYKAGIEVPIRQWRDTMIEAAALSFPLKLDDALEATGLEKKDPRGKQLITLFSSPAAKNHHADRYTWENRPNEWKEFGEYCLQDVRVERQLLHWCRQFRNMSELEWEYWFLDQHINDTGVPVDLELARAALDIWQEERLLYTEELRRMTGLEKVTRGPFLAWLESQGVFLPNTQKDTLAAYIKDCDNRWVRRALQLWSWKEARSLDKFKALLNGTDADQRIRFVLQFAGASRTRRWAGRQLQMQNLKSTQVPGDSTEEIIANVEKLSQQILARDAWGIKLTWAPKSIAEMLGSAIRHAIKASPGHKLCVYDLGSIESVVLGWLTGCKRINNVFANGMDTYKDFATELFQVPYDQVTKKQRKFSKPPVLGCGYHLGWKGLIAYSEGYGVDMSEPEAKHAVDTFRSMYWEVPVFWDWIWQAVKYTTQTFQPVEGYRLKVTRDEKFLYIELPSGRRLSYFLPEVLPHKTPWGEVLPTFSYMGLNDKNKWSRLFVHDGLLTENIIQAIARDILAEGLVRANQQGLRVVAHVHDEIIAEFPEGYDDWAMQVLHEAMTTRPAWGQDLLLTAAGYTAYRYMKD